MTLATTPTQAIDATPRFDRIAAARWDQWHGPMSMWVFLAPGKRPRVEDVKRDHREWLSTLLARGIPLRAIRRHALDDPREPRLVLMAKADLYCERRRRNREH